MAAIPLTCPKGHQFDGRAFTIDGDEPMTLMGSTEKCPTCGEVTTIPDGLYSESEEGRLRWKPLPDD
jgi:hypothetical protein